MQPADAERNRKGHYTDPTRPVKLLISRATLVPPSRKGECHLTGVDVSMRHSQMLTNRETKLLAQSSATMLSRTEQPRQQQKL